MSERVSKEMQLLKVNPLPLFWMFTFLLRGEKKLFKCNFMWNYVFEYLYSYMEVFFSPKEASLLLPNNFFAQL